MKPRAFILRLLLLVDLFRFASGSATIITPSVAVGDPNNPADPNTLYGEVDYTYAIAKYETTINQYTAFLNAVAKTDTYSLWNSTMGLSPTIRGIARSGISGSYSYSVMGDGNRPITYVSWFDAARYVNWLQNGQPTGVQGADTTETGAYALNGATSGTGVAHAADATFWIPTQAEWYKAAYYQPAANGGPASSYWLYPTRSNIQPNSRFGSTTDPNSANYYYDDGIANGYNGGYAVNNSTTYPTGNALTPVGAFTLASSYYGTFDQGGNVLEWTDYVPGSQHAIMGGDFGELEGAMRAVPSVTLASADTEGGNLGFRIAMAVPKPSTAGLLALTAGVLALRRTRPRAGQCPAALDSSSVSISLQNRVHGMARNRAAGMSLPVSSHLPYWPRIIR